MSRTRWMLIASYVASLTALFGVGMGVGRATGDRTTTSRLSPDETLRVRLVESSGTDRTFEVRVEDLVKGETTTVFRSPDEGNPPGTERLIWSKDGDWFLLVGRHFFVREDLFLDNGDQPYFLYHRPTAKAWLNSAQAGQPTALDAEAIDGIEFTEPVTFRKR